MIMVLPRRFCTAMPYKVSHCVWTAALAAAHRLTSPSYQNPLATAASTAQLLQPDTHGSIFTICCGLLAAHPTDCAAAGLPAGCHLLARCPAALLPPPPVLLLHPSASAGRHASPHARHLLQRIQQQQQQEGQRQVCSSVVGRQTRARMLTAVGMWCGHASTPLPHSTLNCPTSILLSRVHWIQVHTVMYRGANHNHPST